MELRQANQQRPNFAHVDIKSAFDSVDRQALWKAIRDFGTPPFRCTATLMPVFDSPQRQECVRDVSYPYTRLRRNRLVCYVTRPLVRESPSLDASFSDLTYAESQMTPSCSQDRRRRRFGHIRHHRCHLQNARLLDQDEISEYRCRPAIS